MGFISGLTSNYLQSALSKVLDASGLTSNVTGSSTSGSSSASSATSVSQTPDVNQVSPFAELLETLQQLQQSNPTKLSQVTQQIATNLTTAATTAQSNGHSAAASVLNQLASDFSKASQNGQLPSISDLAKAIHHHRHHSQSASDSNSTGSSTSSSGSASNSSASQLLAAFQTDASQSDSLNPMSIILNTLSTAGIGTSNGR